MRHFVGTEKAPKCETVVKKGGPREIRDASVERRRRSPLSPQTPLSPMSKNTTYNRTVHALEALPVIR